MKKIVLTVSIIACLLVMLLLSGCGGLYNDKYVYSEGALVGKWVDERLNDSSYDVYEFIDNENVILTTNCKGIELDRLEGTYTVEDNNKLVINSEFGKEYIRFSITKDNRLVILTLNDLDRPAEDERVMEKYSLDYNKGENSLVGTWISKDNENEKFIFNEDFTGKSVGLSKKGEVIEYKLYYSYKGNELNIIIEYMIGYEEMVRTTEFKIESNILTMLGKDKDGKEIKLQFEREN